MANNDSAKKRIRRNNRKSDINGARIARIRTYIKKVELAIAGGDTNSAEENLKSFVQPELYRGVSKGVINKKTAARKLSRLQHRVKNLKSAA